MQGLFLVIMMPSALLVVIGGIVGGVWLAALGQWSALAYGAVALVAPSVLPIVLSPGILLANPATHLIRGGRTGLAMPLVLLSQLLVFCAVGGWGVAMFYLLMADARGETFWPLLLWSYVVALAPWMYLARDDHQSRPGEGSFMAVFFGQVAYIVMATALILYGLPLMELVSAYAMVMGAGVLIQTGATIFLINRRRRAGVP